MKTEDREEALMAITTHYAMPLILEMVEQIVGRIAGGVMSVPLDKDPEKAALTLYAERMKAEGAVAVKNALVTQIASIKAQSREKRQ